MIARREPNNLRHMLSRLGFVELATLGANRFRTRRGPRLLCVDLDPLNGWHRAYYAIVNWQPTWLSVSTEEPIGPAEGTFPIGGFTTPEQLARVVLRLAVASSHAPCPIDPLPLSSPAARQDALLSEDTGGRPGVFHFDENVYQAVSDQLATRLVIQDRLERETLVRRINAEADVLRSRNWRY